MLSYASNIQGNYWSFFLFKSAICQLVALGSFTTAPYYDGKFRGSAQNSAARGNL